MRTGLIIPIVLLLVFFLSIYPSTADEAAIIAITANGTSLDSPVSQNFGRCPYFVFFNCNDGTVTVVENPGVDQQSGAGRNAAELVINGGATHLVTGNIGDKVVDRLRSAEVEIITDLKRSMTVEDAIEMVRSAK